MNTIEELIDSGINYSTATDMIASMYRRIGTVHGDYIITDITYYPEIKEKVVELKCRTCGDIIYRNFKTSRNKWSELKSICRICRSREIEEANSIKHQKKLDALRKRVGKTYGDFKVTSFDPESMVYTLECLKCGDKVEKPPRSFSGRSTFECNNHKAPYIQPIKYGDDYIGKKNNRLTVIGFTYDKSGHRAFECRCDCGNMHVVIPNFWEDGKVKSCGCLAKESQLEHTEELDRLRRIYCGMLQRCHNPNATHYCDYGGRGIVVCDEWKNDREAFIAWALTHGYSNDLSIDRIDNDGIYEPSNCRWADRSTQAKNQRPRKSMKGLVKRRRQKTWTIDGVTKPCLDWCEIYGVSDMFVRYRVNHLGMTVKEALTTPKMTEGRPRKSS